jgi:hypothetical protein
MHVVHCHGRITVETEGSQAETGNMSWLVKGADGKSLQEEEGVILRVIMQRACEMSTLVCRFASNMLQLLTLTLMHSIKKVPCRLSHSPRFHLQKEVLYLNGKTCAAASKLFRFAATRISYEQCAVIPQKHVLDFLLRLPIDEFLIICHECLGDALPEVCSPPVGRIRISTPANF